MNTFFVAVLFACVEGQCSFATTPVQVYSVEAECLADGNEIIQKFSEMFPNGAIQGTCVKVKIGKI
jgi:hypothetical protein